MRYLFILSILLYYTQNSIAQDSNCKVLMVSISGSYEGECKKGKAQGYGKAKGDHSYEGEFKKGRPHGEGTYNWSEKHWYKGSFNNSLKNGYGEMHSNLLGEDSLLIGYWRNDHYIGEEDLDDYEISENRNLEKVSVSLRNKEGASLRVKILRDKSLNANVRNIRVNSSSGHGRKGSSSIVYENIEFPFHFSISYDTPNRTASSTISVSAVFIINTPGQWEIKLEN